LQTLTPQKRNYKLTITYCGGVGKAEPDIVCTVEAAEKAVFPHRKHREPRICF
jgi:hypothetical protein